MDAAAKKCSGAGAFDEAGARREPGVGSIGTKRVITPLRGTPSPKMCDPSCRPLCVEGLTSAVGSLRPAALPLLQARRAQAAAAVAAADALTLAAAAEQPAQVHPQPRLHAPPQPHRRRWQQQRQPACKPSAVPGANAGQRGRGALESAWLLSADDSSLEARIGGCWDTGLAGWREPDPGAATRAALELLPERLTRESATNACNLSGKRNRFHATGSNVGDVCDATVRTPRRAHRRTHPRSTSRGAAAQTVHHWLRPSTPDTAPRHPCVAHLLAHDPPHMETVTSKGFKHQASVRL
eukprot:121639-Chlamydomonas_euryale.AAC.8